MTESMTIFGMVEPTTCTCRGIYVRRRDCYSADDREKEAIGKQMTLIGVHVHFN